MDSFGRASFDTGRMDSVSEIPSVHADIRICRVIFQQTMVIFQT